MDFYGRVNKSTSRTSKIRGSLCQSLSLPTNSSMPSDVLVIIVPFLIRLLGILVIHRTIIPTSVLQVILWVALIAHCGL